MPRRSAQRLPRLATLVGVAILFAACTGDSQPPAEPSPTPTTKATSPSTSTPDPTQTAEVKPELAQWARSYCGALNVLTIQPDPFDLSLSPSGNFDDQMVWVAKQIPNYIQSSEETLRRIEEIEAPEPAAEYQRATTNLVQALIDDLNVALPKIVSARDVAEFVAARDSGEASPAATQRLADSSNELEPAVLAALRAEPLCDFGSSPDSDGGSIRSADIDPVLDTQLLINVADLVAANWRFAEFDDADYRQVPPSESACAAELPTLTQLGGPLRTTSTSAPNTWGVRFLFNGAMGLDGSQLWSEVWAFDTEDSALDSFQNTRQVMDSGRGPVCLDTSASLAEDANGYAAISDPDFQLPNSISYTLDTRAGNGSDAIEAHVEVHIIQRGRFVGMLIFYDHSPSDLWQHDGQRLLQLFESRLTTAATE